MNVADELVEVNEDERREAYDFSFEEFPDACLKKKGTAVTKGGLTAMLERFGQEVKLDDSHVRVIRSDWGGVWEKEFYRYGNTFGMAVVKPIPHKKVPGEAKMLLVPWNKYKVSFSTNSKDEREYFVTYTDASYDDSGERQPVSAWGGRMSSANRVQPNEVKKLSLFLKSHLSLRARAEQQGLSNVERRHQ